MSDPESHRDPAPKPATKPPAEKKAVPSKEQPGSPNDLTPEEQLARYEESLKNDDWGHQPC